MLDDALVLSKYRLDKKNVIVSILIVLDDALVLRADSKLIKKINAYNVSILIVLDDALVLEKQRLY